MEEQKFGIEEFSLGVVIGLAVGFGAGLLLAPEAGVTTREKIAGRSAEFKEIASELAERTKEALDVVMAKIEENLGWEEKGARKQLKEIKGQVEKYISEA